MSDPGANARPSHVWVMDLPTGWASLPGDGGPTDALDDVVAATPEEARPAARVVAGRLRADRAGGAAAVAWSHLEVGGRRLVAAHSVFTNALDRRPVGDDVALATAQPVELPGAPAHLDVVLRRRDGVALLEVVHTVEVPSADRTFQLVGHAAHVALADQMVRMFHLMAATFEVVAADGPQPAVVRE